MAQRVNQAAVQLLVGFTNTIPMEVNQVVVQYLVRKRGRRIHSIVDTGYNWG